MKKTYTIEEITYVIRTCTAIANCDLKEVDELYNEDGDTDYEAMRLSSVNAAEDSRQSALHITSIMESGETSGQLVFNQNIPEAESDFLSMCESPEDWETDYEPLSVIFDDDISEDPFDLSCTPDAFHPSNKH